MTPNNNLSVLPFYEGVQYQDYKKSYAYGDVYPLFTPLNKILPFQIIRPTRSNNIVYARLYDYKFTRILADIKTPMMETGLQIVRFQNYRYDVIVYPGLLPMALDFPEGRYMIGIYDGVQWFYSEVFTWIAGEWMVIYALNGATPPIWRLTADKSFTRASIQKPGLRVPSWESRNISLRKRAKSGTGIFSPKNKYPKRRSGLYF